MGLVYNRNNKTWSGFSSPVSSNLNFVEKRRKKTLRADNIIFLRSLGFKVLVK